MARKKTFPCGHKGKGSFCHSCRAEEISKEQQAARARGTDEPDGTDKEAWKRRFASDPIPLTHLPNKGLVRRARTILAEIGRGAPWHQFNGKRLQHDRTIISVPLGRRYRIIFRADSGTPVPVEVMSHESYNATKPGRR